MTILFYLSSLKDGSKTHQSSSQTNLNTFSHFQFDFLLVLDANSFQPSPHSSSLWTIYLLLYCCAGYLLLHGDDGTALHVLHPGFLYLIPNVLSYDYFCEDRLEKVYIHFNVLLQNGLDFTFLDSRSLEQAELKDGILTIGLGRYSVIVLPETTVMSLAAAQKLADFESQGGLIVWTGSKPTITARFGESDALASIVADLGVKYTGLNVECLALLRSVAHPVINVAGGNTICISHYTRPDCGKEIFYLANLSDSAAAVTVSFPDNASFDVYIPMDGNIVSISGSAELEVPPYEGVLVVR